MVTKSPVNTSLMKNSPSTKPTANKGAAKKTDAMAKGNNTKAAASNSKAKPSNRGYTRNGAVSTLIGSSVAAFGGAAVIVGLDVLVNRFMPQISSGVRTTIKVVGGVGFKMFGKKLPVVGRYNDTIGNALLLAGALDILGNTVVPYFVGWLSPSAAVSAPVVVKDATTGQLGYQYQMPTGETVQVFDDWKTDNYVPQNYGSYQGAAYYQ